MHAISVIYISFPQLFQSQLMEAYPINLDHYIIEVRMTPGSGRLAIACHLAPRCSYGLKCEAPVSLPSEIHELNVIVASWD